MNHRTAVMKATMDHDSINSRVRVRRGKNRRARNTPMATANTLNSVNTGHGSDTNAPDHTSTRAARAKHSISMD